MSRITGIIKRFDGWIDKKVQRTFSKYLEIPVGRTSRLREASTEAPYKYSFPPEWIYRLRRNSPLLNNAIEEIVNQTFRRGLRGWEKAYEAKCPECSTEFEAIEDVRDEVADPEGETIDLDDARSCPECEATVVMEAPDEAERERAEDFFARANGRKEWQEHLEPGEFSSASQTFEEVLKEISRDIHSFDDGWMLYERNYAWGPGGRIRGWSLEGVHRGPPELMEYSHSGGTYGGEYWVCVRCRANEQGYTPAESPGDCEECGARLHEVYAVVTESARSNDPMMFLVRGEFAHRSQYFPSKFHGWPPVVTLYDEARTLEQMDKWYRQAYEQRRAPRGALAIRSSNQESTIEWNKKQAEKMDRDPNHVPTMIDDSESGQGDPIKFISLLETPAEMQHMEMREWFKKRISAKFGVTAVFQDAAGGDSGLSQSLEIQVSNRAADRHRKIMNEGFVYPTIAQLGIDGWETEIEAVEEDDESAEAEIRHKNLQLAQLADQLGLDAEWTRDDRADVEPGSIEGQEQEGMGLGGMMGEGGPGGGDGFGPPDEGASAEDAQPTDVEDGGESLGGSPRRDDSTGRGE